jgi:hypothetical protein
VNGPMKRLLLLALAAVPAFAQPSATMRPDLLASFDLNYSWSSKEDIARGPATLGTLSVEQYGFSASTRLPRSQSTMLVAGLAFNTHDFKFTGPLPIPEDLTEFSLNLGVQRRFDERWSGAVFARPGFYGDLDSGIDTDALNVPVLAVVNYAPSRALVWTFGLNLNAFSDNPVLPVAGVRWTFAPEWTFNVGFPRSGLIWRATDRLEVTGGVWFSGGSFRLTQNLGVPATGIPRLANTFVDFREVRAGVALDYALTDRAKLRLDLGAVTDRKIDYFDKGYRLDGDGGTFLGLSVIGSF